MLASTTPRTKGEKARYLGARLLMSIGVFLGDVGGIFARLAAYKLAFLFVIVFQVSGAMLGIYAGAPKWAAWIFGGIILLFSTLMTVLLLAFVALAALYAHSLWDRAGKEKHGV